MTDRFGTMTDEEYNLAFSNYDNLNSHEQIILLRRTLTEIQDFLDARNGLRDIAEIRRYVQLLPSIQTRQAVVTRLSGDVSR
tara:strand:+ start:3679 stop:3924 length:246 start_codon:yes stop_codon:yes gene_type:complete